MNKLIIFLLSTFSLQWALAVDGTLNLRSWGTSASMAIEQSGNEVTGNIFGFGRSHGQLNIKKTDHWKGRYGHVRVEIYAVEQRDSGETRMTIRTFPGGFYNYMIRPEGDLIKVSGRTPDHRFVNARINGKYEFSASGDFYTTFLERTAPDMLEGRTYGNHPRHRGQSFSMEMTTSGSLDLENITSDLELLMLVYVLPFHMVN